MMRIEIARTGIYNGKQLTKDDLREVVETFKGDVPIALGHNLADHLPAFGWVKSVEVKDDTLYGDVELLPPLSDAYDQGFYRNWSIGLRRGDDGKKYLHHLAFLGAVPPAIKGLKPVGEVAFSDDIERFEGFADKPPPLSELPIKDIAWDVNKATRHVFDKYGIAGLKAYSLYADPNADPETKSAYKFLVVDIVDGKPVIVKKAVAAGLAYLHGARGANVSPEVADVVEPKLNRLKKRIDTQKKKEEPMKFSDLPKEEQERVLAEAKKKAQTELQAAFADREAELIAELKAQKRRELEEAMKGKVPKEKHQLVLALSDALSPAEKLEFSDGDAKVQKSAIDVLIEILRAIPEPVAVGKEHFSDDGHAPEGVGELLKYV